MRPVPAVVVVLLLAVAAVPAVAATRHGITPLSPKPGATVPAGSSPTFRARVKGKGAVWIYVCKSRKRNTKGLICSTEMIERAARKNGRVSLRPTFYDYPSFWLNAPGTYYWQAHRIRCEHGNTTDCSQEGPVVKFTVG